MDFDELINRLFNLLNELTKRGDLTISTTKLSNEFLETLKIIENCTSCKKDNIKEKYHFDKFHKSINKIEKILVELEKGERGKYEIIRQLDNKLIKIDDKLNIKVLCESCKEKKIGKLNDKCGNEKMARLLYECKLNSIYNSYIRWIPFNEFRNIEYLAKGGFGEVHKARWIGYYNEDYEEKAVVLKRLYNSNDSILDILKELKTNNEFGGWVNQCFGITKDSNENDYLLVFDYAENGDLHNYLSKNFKEITWQDKIQSLSSISKGLEEIHKKNYIHHDLHSGNIFSYYRDDSKIGDLGLCQRLNENDDPNKIFGVIPYLAPEVLSKKPYAKESEIYSFAMIMWEFTTGIKPFHNRPHNHLLISDILNGERPQVTGDTPEFYAELMKRCWDNNPENRPTAKEINDCLREYNQYRINNFEEKKEIIKLAEAKRQEIIKSDKFLSDIKNYKHHPRSFYTSRLLNESIKQVESLNEITQNFNTLVITKDNG